MVRSITVAKGSRDERVALEYPLTAIELNLGPDLKGQGKFYESARIRSVSEQGFVFDSLFLPLQLGDMKPRVP